jgi:hypothetical protein
MAQVGKVIYDLLSNDANITSAVGTRIYPVFAPQEAADPCITYGVEQTEYFHTKDAAATLHKNDCTVNVFSKTYSECEDISEYVISAMDRFSGTNNGVKVSNIVVTDRTRDFDPTDRVFVNILEFDIMVNV